jgi:uncharacterized beta-barrel protein YwiB (DUF1934 family)
MFWTADEDFSKPVTVHWVRISHPLMDGSVAREEETEEYVVPGAVWRQRNGLHYLTYHDPNVSDENSQTDSPLGDARSGGNRTTLRLESQQVTLIRFGDVAWNHTFRANVRSTSSLHMGQGNLAVEIDTHGLSVEVEQAGGRIRCEYVLLLADVPQQVKLEITFH